MLIQILIVVVSLVFIVLGADWLVDGASSIAKKAGVSEFVIGLTIVGMGTSAPEMVVSFIGAIQGNADVAVGNVVGSNIFNTLLILGVTALILPLYMTKSNRHRDIPLNIGVVLLLAILGMTKTIFGFGSNTLTRLDGLILLVLFASYMYYYFTHDEGKDEEGSAGKIHKVSVSIFMVLLGLASLVVGGQFFVGSAQKIAKMIGISDKVIAITVLAGGTSLPELATCVVAAFKKRSQMALGNILGSNIFNILLILGGSALIHPLSFANMNLVDMGVLLLSALLLWAFAYTPQRNKLDRADGLVFILIFIAYIYILLNH
jgi:cation:H+ antiporter